VRRVVGSREGPVEERMMKQSSGRKASGEANHGRAACNF
jgi:hypothetical protein